MYNMFNVDIQTEFLETLQSFEEEAWHKMLYEYIFLKKD